MSYTCNEWGPNSGIFVGPGASEAQRRKEEINCAGEGDKDSLERCHRSVCLGEGTGAIQAEAAGKGIAGRRNSKHKVTKVRELVGRPQVPTVSEGGPLLCWHPLFVQSSLTENPVISVFPLTPPATLATGKGWYYSRLAGGDTRAQRPQGNASIQGCTVSAQH